MSDLAIQSVQEKVLALGDLSKLSTNERTNYYVSLCQSIGLNPLTRPFEFIVLSGKLTLYARKDATDQVRALKSVSVKIVDRAIVGDVYTVTAHATLPGGRCDESTGSVFIGGLKGENLANAYMKAETKAKRRVTLSICGLGFLDETEAPTIPDAQPWVEPQEIKQVEAELPPSAPEPKFKKVIATPIRESAPPPAAEEVPWDESGIEINLTELKAETDVLISALGWNAAKGAEHLTAHFGKSKRNQLSPIEYLDFRDQLLELKANQVSEVA
jgi:hypothetical protein